MDVALDPRIVVGARCTWWDAIHNVGHLASGLPCCPHCGSVLFEYRDERHWWEQVDRWEAAGHPGYRALVEWSRGRCFPSLAAVQAAFLAARPRA